MTYQSPYTGHNFCGKLSYLKRWIRVQVNILQWDRKMTFICVTSLGHLRPLRLMKKTSRSILRVYSILQIYLLSMQLLYRPCIFLRRKRISNATAGFDEHTKIQKGFIIFHWRSLMIDYHLLTLKVENHAQLCHRTSSIMKP